MKGDKGEQLYDGNGRYLWTKGEHFGFRYEVMDEIWRGEHTQIFKCLDHKSGSLVAAKMYKSTELSLSRAQN